MSWREPKVGREVRFLTELGRRLTGTHSEDLSVADAGFVQSQQHPGSGHARMSANCAWCEHMGAWSDCAGTRP